MPGAANKPKRSSKRRQQIPDVPRVAPFRALCLKSGFSYTTMRDRAQAGDLKVIVIGKHSWYVAITEWQRFIADNTKTGTQLTEERAS